MISHVFCCVGSVSDRFDPSDLGSLLSLREFLLGANSWCPDVASIFLLERFWCPDVGLEFSLRVVQGQRYISLRDLELRTKTWCGVRMLP